MERNIALNNLKGVVKTFNLAVVDENGTVKLKIAKTSSGHNSILRKDLPVDREEEVQQVRLDDFLDLKRVDFVKLDVEGYEYLAIKGWKILLKITACGCLSNSPQNLWGKN